MADPVRITFADMEIAAVNVAARRGWSVEELRDRVRNPQRTCKAPACEKTFTVTDDRKRYCTETCKADAHRVRTGVAT